jgi:hypothetical protein
MKSASSGLFCGVFLGWFRSLSFGLLLGAALAGPALAHDTWFVPKATTDRGERLFALGTGTMFPQQDVPVSLKQLQSSGCRGEGQRAAPMRWVADAPAALMLRSARPVPLAVALTCWAQLIPIDIEIDDPTVEIYLKEINALPAVRERWESLRARGIRWQESYVKHARIEVDGEGAPAAAAAAAGAAPIEGLGMDLRLETPQRPLRAGDTLRFQLLRDGKPLAGLPLELRSDLSPIGLWRTTDAEGRVELAVPLAGRWLLRGTDVRPSTQNPDRWESRFVTLAFEVLKKP